MFFISLFIIGTAFGSFSTVLIERWHSGKGGILLGRSECPVCKNTLSWHELFPIFSFLFQQGKCHSCKTKISLCYPIAEIIMGIIFLIIGTVFVGGTSDIFSGQMFILFILGFITGVYILYDAKYTEIPDQVMIPGIYLYFILLVGAVWIPEWELYIFDIATYRNMTELFFDHIFAAIVLYSFFYLQILIPGGFFLIKKKRYYSFIELISSYFIFPIILPFQSFMKKNEEPEEEIPAWIGGGDLRIALFIGLTLGIIHGVVAFFLAYCIGSIIGIMLIIKNGGKNRQIPFGPFLGIGWLISIYFHTEILSYFISIY